MPSTVAVLGDALLDVHAVPSVPMRPGADVVAAITLRPGGQGGNLAVRLARRGVPVRLICAIGDDAAGTLLRGALEADGVQLREVRTQASGVVIALIDPDGERTMLSQRVPLLDGAAIVDAAGDADWLLVSGYVLLERPTLPDGSRLPRRRAVIGCTVQPGQAQRWLSRVEALAPSLLVVNRDEASVLLEGRPGAAALARLVGALTVVTDRSGAVGVVGEDEVRVTTASTDVATDTTGAGDAFAAVLVAGLLEAAWPPSPDVLRAAMKDASDAAAAVAHVAGAQGPVAGERDRVSR